MGQSARKPPVAPRTVISTVPAVNTRAAQIAPPRSSGGRAGQTHGVVHPAASTDSVISQ